MRRVLTLVLVGAAVVAAGCASSKSAKAGKPAEVAVAEPARPAEMKPAEAAATEAARPAEVQAAEPAPRPAPVAVVAPVEKAPAPVAEPKPAVPANLDEVAGLPAYPGASRTKLDTSAVPTYEWSRKIKVELAATATFQSVKAFYEKVIKDNGWQVTGISEKADEVRWKLARNGAVAEVKVEQKARNQVEIRLERKDR